MSAFARILIDRSEGRELDYAVPSEFSGEIRIGVRVVVMVRNRRAVGTVMEILEESKVPGLRPILGLVGGETTITPVMMRLARWMADPLKGMAFTCKDGVNRVAKHRMAHCTFEIRVHRQGVPDHLALLHRLLRRLRLLRHRR